MEYKKQKEWNESVNSTVKRYEREAQKELNFKKRRRSPINMMTEQKIIRNKVGLLKLAQQLESGSKACNVMDFRRDSALWLTHITLLLQRQ